MGAVAVPLKPLFCNLRQTVGNTPWGRAAVRTRARDSRPGSPKPSIAALGSARAQSIRPSPWDKGLWGSATVKPLASRGNPSVPGGCFVGGTWSLRSSLHRRLIFTPENFGEVLERTGRGDFLGGEPASDPLFQGEHDPHVSNAVPTRKGARRRGRTDRTRRAIEDRGYDSPDGILMAISHRPAPPDFGPNPRGTARTRPCRILRRSPGSISNDERCQRAGNRVYGN